MQAGVTKILCATVNPVTENEAADVALAASVPQTSSPEPARMPAMGVPALPMMAEPVTVNV